MQMMSSLMHFHSTQDMISPGLCDDIV